MPDDSFHERVRARAAPRPCSGRRLSRVTQSVGRNRIQNNLESGHSVGTLRMRADPTVFGRRAMKTSLARYVADASDIPWILLYSVVVAVLILSWAYVPA